MSNHYTYTEELTVNQVYTETPPQRAGFTTYVNGEVDTSTPGTYEVTYTFLKLDPFETDTEVKLVTVTAEPQNNASISLIGDAVISIDLDDVATYVDEGATSTDGTVFVTNLDGTTSESFTGLPNVAGSYTLIYYVSGAFSNFVTRTIHVAEGLNAPSSGPNNVNAVVNPPVEGPANLTAINLTTNPPVEGPTNLTAVLETAPVKPAIGYPIVSSSGTSLAVKPAVGYPIVGKPAVGYPIDSVQL